MIVRSQHDFMIIWGQKSYSDCRETARAQSEVLGTPHGHRTGSISFPLKVFGDPPYNLCMFLTQSLRHLKLPLVLVNPKELVSLSLHD